MRSHGWFVVGITAIMAAVAGTSASLTWSPRESLAASPPSPFVKVDSNGNPARWDPCAPLQWKIAGSHPSRRLRLAARNAMRQIGRATGMSFAYAGRATEAEFASPPRNTIVIGATRNLGVANAGGVANLTYSSTASGGWSITAARVAINPVVVKRGTRFSSMLLPIVLHEMGHAVGLAHVTDSHEIMYPQVVKVGSYTADALRHLRSLGASMGCLAPAATAA